MCINILLTSQLFLPVYFAVLFSAVCIFRPVLLLTLLHFSPPVPPPPSPVSRFAGKTVSGGSLVLVTVVKKEAGEAHLTVNCEKMVIGTMLVKDILHALTQ